MSAFNTCRHSMLALALLGGRWRHNKEVTAMPRTYTREQDENYRPTLPFREAVAASQLSLNEIALRMGWRIGNAGDLRRLKRTLGLQPNDDGHYQQYLSYDNAVAIVQALGGDPVDYGV